MPLEEDATGGAVCHAQLRGEGDDAVGELQGMRIPLAAHESLNGLLRVGVDGHRLRAKSPSV
eukprot:3054168-Alexandrium_andersonii.AAC.1